MLLKSLLICVTLVAAPCCALYSQSDCPNYKCLRDQLKQLITAKDYRFALSLLDYAETLRDKNRDEINIFRNNLFDAIHTERLKAEKERSEAVAKTVL
ncbi:MAG: hypothetical protein RIS64_1337, partial [Bacteroidota bacterium]